VTPPAAPATVHVLKVTLDRVRPVVWRRLEVPSAITLGDLDEVLQLAFGWAGGHLHQFEVRGVGYGPGELRDGASGTDPHHTSVQDEDRAGLSELLPRRGDEAEYTYDLGDDWRHRIHVEQVHPAQPGEVYLRCVAGSGLPPEEDTGRVRRGRFGEVERRELNDVLLQLGAVPGRDLVAPQPDPDQVFAGLFPEIAATAEPDCWCGECREKDEDAVGSGAGDMPLPVLQPEPDDVLAAAAEASPLVQRALALADWIGPARQLTPAHVLRPAEALEASTTLGLDRPVLPAAGGAPPRSVTSRTRRPGTAPGRGGAAVPRSAKDLPALNGVWRAAVSAGLIEVRGQKAYPGPGLAVWGEPAEPQGRLVSWASMLAGYLQTRSEAARTDRSWGTLTRGPLLPMSALMLYTSAKAPLWAGLLGLGTLSVTDDEDPTALLELPEVVAAWVDVLEDWATTGVVAAAPEQDIDALTTPDLGAAEMMAQVQDLLGELAQVPVVGRIFTPVIEAARQGPVVEVTSFGRYALARVLRGHGVSIPSAGHLADTAPGELLLALGNLDPQDAVEEVRRWLDARGEAWQSALRDVVRSASVKGQEGSARRSVLPLVAGVAAVAAPAMLDEWQQDPWLTAPITLGRHAAGQGPEPSPYHLLWMAVDALSLGLNDEEAFDDLIDSTQVSELLAAPGALATAVTLDHPHSREVLRRLAQELQDLGLARELRRALGERPRSPRTKRR
jgi:hypothetical protein